MAAGIAAFPGCSLSEPDAEGGQAPPATVESVLARSSQVMDEVESASFALERTGADVFLDEGGSIRFDSARGRYVAPSSADAVLEVEAMGFATEVGAVVIDGESWLTNPVSSRWEPAPPNLSFDPATLFDAEVGFPSLLSQGLTEAELVEPGPDDQGRYHVRGTVAGDRVATLTGGLVETETEVDLWIDAETSRVAEVRFDAPAPDGGTSTWRMVLDDYGEQFTITKPVPGSSTG